MDNLQIAAIFYEVADILELQGVAFKPNAYRRAARSIEQLDEDISKLAAEDRLREIPGVGESVSKKIQEILKTGGLSYLQKLRGQIPAGLLDVLSVPDIGPKTAMTLYRELGITNLDQLKQAVSDHRLRTLKGFGEKTEEKILRGLGTVEAKGRRILLGDAFPVAAAYVEHLKSLGSLGLVSVAGSLRRGKETVGDIDILVGDDKPESAMEAFVNYSEVDKVIMRGSTKSSVALKNKLQVDIRAVETKSYGAALQYFTGSKEHNVELRKMGVEKGLKLNEYGVFERDSNKMIAGDTEEGVYRALGLPFIPPELRENMGEIGVAREGKLPVLLEAGDVRGDTHVHTDWSDGANSIEDIVSSAISRGYAWVAITDHSQSLKLTNGLTPERLRRQIGAVRKAEDKAGGKIRVLAGSEVDIKADGSLDYSSSLLKDLDIVIGSIHSMFKMPKEEMTARILNAVESGLINVLGHPTGRIIGKRSPYEFDLQRVLQAARESGVFMELNSFPDRLDLSDIHCKLAKEAGVKVVIGTDAHSVVQMDFMKFGIITARRGWLGREDVLNAMPARSIMSRLRRG